MGQKNKKKLIYSYFSSGNRNSIEVSSPVLTWGFGQLNADPVPPEILQKRCGVTSHQVSACSARAAKSLLLTRSSAGTGAHSPPCCISGVSTTWAVAATANPGSPCPLAPNRLFVATADIFSALTWQALLLMNLLSRPAFAACLVWTDVVLLS